MTFFIRSKLQITINTNSKKKKKKNAKKQVKLNYMNNKELS